MGSSLSSPLTPSIRRSDKSHKYHTEVSPPPTVDYTALNSTEELLKIVRCPVCLEIPTPPIYNCRKGHTICGVCRTQLLNRRCVICKAMYTNSRNFALESIVQTSKFVCHFELGENKCNLILPGFQLKRHSEDQCKFPHARIFSKSL